MFPKSQKIDFTTLSGNYSTTEIDTGFTWIDGKHIYKKTINCGTVPDGTTKRVGTGVTGINEIIKFEGYSHNAASLSFAPFPQSYRGNGSMYSGASVMARYDKSNNSLDIYQDAGFAGQTITVTIYYTKTS